MTDARMSPDGVIAVYAPHHGGGHAMPWSVTYVPPGHRTNWPTQILTPHAVATWAVLRPTQTQEYAA